jgi:hypothetical protein
VEARHQAQLELFQHSIAGQITEQKMDLQSKSQVIQELKALYQLNQNWRMDVAQQTELLNQFSREVATGFMESFREMQKMQTGAVVAARDLRPPRESEGGGALSQALAMVRELAGIVRVAGGSTDSDNPLAALLSSTSASASADKGRKEAPNRKRRMDAALARQAAADPKRLDELAAILEDVRKNQAPRKSEKEVVPASDVASAGGGKVGEPHD